MANMTMATDSTQLPPLPTYHLEPQPPLLPFMSDKTLVVVGPIVLYWAFSMLFHWIDELDLFPQYRLHTPAEILKRNRVTRWEVIRDVLLQQVVQFIVGYLLAGLEPDQMIGKENYDISVWAQRIRLAQRTVPAILGSLGLDSIALGNQMSNKHPALAGMLLGGQYPQKQPLIDVVGGKVALPQFAPWEILLARVTYHALIPAVQFLGAIIFVDTWQYFLHRAMHMNKWLYTTLHSRHHRLYVPYAYGALYNHPVEGFVLDTLGASIAYLIAGMTPRQGLVFFCFSTVKTIDDHCGYALPFDPLQLFTSNNAGYHDIHHQSWGIKSNFSQPFSTFWDRFFGTEWTGGDVSGRYERSRAAAQKALDEEKEKEKTTPVESAPAPQASLADSSSSSSSIRRSPRKRALSAKSINGFRDRMGGSMSCGPSIMGVNTGSSQ